jgi:hypothetical protein
MLQVASLTEICLPVCSIEGMERLSRYCEHRVRVRTHTHTHAHTHTHTHTHTHAHAHIHTHTHTHTYTHIHTHTCTHAHTCFQVRPSRLRALTSSPCTYLRRTLAPSLSPHVCTLLTQAQSVIEAPYRQELHAKVHVRKWHKRLLYETGCGYMVSPPPPTPIIAPLCHGYPPPPPPHLPIPPPPVSSAPSPIGTAVPDTNRSIVILLRPTGPRRPTCTARPYD